MRYTKREVKLVDLFALVLVAIGMISLLVGFAAPAPSASGPVVKAKPGGYVVSAKGGKEATRAKTFAAKGEKPAVLRQSKGGDVASAHTAARHIHPVVWLGVCFLALGVALHLGVRRVVRNNLEDVGKSM